MKMSRAGDEDSASNVLSGLFMRSPGDSRTFRAVLGKKDGKSHDVPLSEPYKYVSLCLPGFWLPGMFIPCLVTGQRFLKSYEITVRNPVNPARFYLEYSEIAVHHEGANYWWIIPGFPGACFPYCCSAVTERRRDGHIHDWALVGWAEEPEFRKSMVRFEMVESND